MVLAEKLHIIHMDGKARAAACGERYVDRFEGVGLHSPLLEMHLDECSYTSTIYGEKCFM
jgi:hypothetical protein